MKKFLNNLIASGALTLMFVFLPGGAAHALTISPPTYDFTANPGDAILDVLRLYNESDMPLTVYPELKDFTADKKENGDPQFVDPKDTADGTGVSQWVTVDTKPVTLAPGERYNLQFSINVPKDNVQPGGHYGAIMLATTPPAENGKVGVGSQLGALILLRVSGQVDEQAKIAEFGYKKPQLWYNYLPVDFYLRFENDGNTHLRPVGNLIIKDWLGRQVATIPVNGDMRSVLPHSIRRFEFGFGHDVSAPGDSELMKEWKNFAFGKYTATLLLTYGTDSKMITDEREFTVWPWRILLAVAAAVLLALVLLTLMLKAYNRSVIRRYEKMRSSDKK